MKGVWKEIHAWLDENAPQMIRRLRPGASEAEIKRVEAAIGIAFPDAFRVSLRIHDGQTPSAPGLIERWHLMGLDQIMEGLLNFRRLAAEPGKHRIRTEGPVKAVWVSSQWLPFADDHAGSCYALDFDPAPHGTRGQVVHFDSHSPDRKVIAPSYEALLTTFVTDLHARRIVPDVEDGEFLGLKFSEERHDRGA